MSVCLYLGGKATVIAASTFTLAWVHSVEKVRWEEDWTLTPAGLELVEGRVKGSGAGMEVPDGGVLRDGVWHFDGNLAPQPALLLARSGATGGGWEVCAEGKCLSFGATADDPAAIKACEAGDAGPDAQ